VERMRTDYTGAIAATYNSMSWGDGYTPSVQEPWADQDNLHYGQLQHDAESGTEHAQFRQYSSSVGRWMSPDPYDGSYRAANPQSFNRYSYVMNRPLSGVDPSGMDDQTDCPDDSGCYDGGGGEEGEGFGGGDPINPYVPCAANDPNCNVTVTATPLCTVTCFVYQSTPLTGNISGPGGGSKAPSNGRVANTITCGTVLPNGQTVGSYVNQLSNSINGSAGNPTSTPYGPGPNPSAPGPISVASQVYSGTNFRKMFGGPGANYAFLGDAGNFAYAAVSANIGVPLIATELAAGAYTLLTHPLSDLGPYGMDPSARVQIPAGYGAGCKVP